MGKKRHFKKGDTVYILSGDDRGASGKVIDVLTSSERVVVEGLNIVKKHIRKNQDQPQGEIAEREGTIHWSNVMREERYNYSNKRKPKDALVTEDTEGKSETEE